MENYSINKIDYESSYPNKGGKCHLTEKEYYWTKSYMISNYGKVKESNKELKNKINERKWKNGGNN